MDLERRNFLILLVAGALALAAAMGLADMAGYKPLFDAVQDVVPTWFAVCFGGQVVAYLGYVLAVRDIARVDGGPLLSFRLSMQSVVAGFGVFAATHAAGGFSVDYWTFRRSGLRRQDAVARVLALGALEYAVLAPAAMICAVVLLLRHRRPRPARDDLPVARGRPGLPRRAVGELAEACRRGSPTRGRRACAPVVRPRSSPGSPSSAAFWPRRARTASASSASRLYWLGDIACLWAALKIYNAEVSIARADPRLRHRLRRDAALAAVRAAPASSR